MEGPGMSLFQGAGSIHINNSAQERLEEQEDLEDQKRRNAELKQQLDHAFNDFIDDDEASSVNSSANFTMDGQQINGRLPAEGSQFPPHNLPAHLNHLKEHCTPKPYHGMPQPYQDTPQAYLLTPQPHQEAPKPYHDLQGYPLQHQIYQDNFSSPYGAGDGQNNYFQDLKGQLNGLHNLDSNQNLLKQYTELKLQYELRIKETESLASQLHELRCESEKETDSLKARLLAAVSDRDKAALSLQQAQQLLEASKHELVNREQRFSELQEQLARSEVEREQVKLELRSVALELQGAQQRLHGAQVAHSHDTDALFREFQDSHREEVDRLHNDVLKLKNRLEEKENEIKQLETREREKEKILIEKSTTVNRLADELENAQRRLASGEAARLRDRLEAVTSERNTAREQLKEFGSKLELTARDLVLSRNKQQATEKEYENWRTTLNQILAECAPCGTGEPQSPGKLSTLKDVLSRYKQQSQKITSLQEEIKKRDKKHEQQRKSENELKAKLDEQKAVETQLMSKLAMVQNKLELVGERGDSVMLEKSRAAEIRARDLADQWEQKYTELESEYEKLKSEKGNRANLVQEANAELLKELEKYSAQLKETLQENVELKNLYLQACSSREAVAREIKDIQTKHQREKEQLKTQEKDLEKEKQNNEKLKEELASCKEELERDRKRVVELQKELTEKQKDFTNKLDKYLQDEQSSLRKELESCAQCEKHVKTIRNLEEQISKFSIKLATQGSNEELMKELKMKAEFFENYIMERFKKLQEQKTVGTNTDAVENGVRNEDELVRSEASGAEDDLEAKTNIMMKEREIRDQIAQKFTLEIKTVEMNCAKRIKEIENESLNNMAVLKQLVEKKAQEVETLTEFIITERNNVQKILNSKENEISVLIKEHNSLQQNYQNLKDKVSEYKQKMEKYQEKSRLIEEKFKSDKENSKKSIDEFEKEKQGLHSKLIQLESELQTLKIKYKNAKKTAYMYKEYISKKEEHVTGELGRIQREYRDVFASLQAQLDQLLRRGGPSTSTYTEKINRLQNDITALAQNRYDEPTDWKGT